jgi:hypothetical protein
MHSAWRDCYQTQKTAIASVLPFFPELVQSIFSYNGISPSMEPEHTHVLTLQQQIYLNGSRNTSTESCNSCLVLHWSTLDMITYS